MGCCCSASGDGGGIEMAAVAAPAVEVDPKRCGKAVKAEGNKISGAGVALATDTLEQDSAYWECVVTKGSGKWAIGVAPKNEKDKEHIADSSALTAAEELEVKDGDVIGCVFSFSNFPVLQFYKNGEAIDGQGVNKVKGDVYPAVSVSDGAELELIFAEGQFKHEPPSPKYTAVMKCQVSYKAFDC